MTTFLLSILLAAVSVPASQTSPPNTDNAERVAVPEPSAKAMDYYRSGNWLWVISRVTALAIPALVLVTGLSVRLRNLAQRIGRKWIFVVLFYFMLYSLLTFAVDLPLAFYAGYVRPHAYGLSNQSFQKWGHDLLLRAALEIGFGGLLACPAYWLISRSPRRWWLYAALLSLPIMFFLMFVEPIWIDPLFNDFGPMKDNPLEAQILALADRAGIEDGRVFEVNKSVDTKAVNAYVTGLGGSKRIVLWDTLIAKLSPEEVRVVIAHEMGHYVLNHVLEGLLAAFCGILAGLYLVGRGATFLLARCRCRLGFDRLSDVASLPLLILLGQLAGLALLPLGLALSRHIEHEADRFALELTRDNRAAAMAFVDLQQENLSNPRPGILFTLLRASHPSIGERIDFANDYRPWEEGQPLCYGSLIRKP